MRIRTDRSLALSYSNQDVSNHTLATYIQQVAGVAAAGAVYQAPESSLALPHDTSILSSVDAVLQPLLSDSLEYVFLVGIGGSNLGAVAITDAVRGRFSAKQPELINLDTVAGKDLRNLESRFSSGLHPSSYVVFVISKSGGTVETIANTELLLSQVLSVSVKDVTSRMVVISDDDSPLSVAAQAADIATLSIPAVVGGRYSVFSAVGLAPMRALGIDVEALLQGAQDILPFCLHDDLVHNPAAIAALHQYEEWQAGKTVHDMFCFAPELESVGKWYRQLLGESIGKSPTGLDQSGVGLVPTVSIGSTDLHSMGQLYLGGHNTVLTTFVYDASRSAEASVPNQRLFPELVPAIAEHTPSSLMRAIQEGTIAAYNDANRAFLAIELDGITEYELGALMQCKMLEVMYLGHLFAVNPFDQPAVEGYKKHTRDYLANTHSE